MMFNRSNGSFPKPPKLKKSYQKQLNKIIQKKTFLPLNFHVKWINSKGTQCKLIQKTNSCFCGHHLDSHFYHEEGSLHCSTVGCNCKAFEYIPIVSLKCLCKHTYLNHQNEMHKCQKCSNCIGFTANWYCKCGYGYLQHNNHVSLLNDKENNMSINSLPKICKTLPTCPSTKKKEKKKVSFDILQMQSRINQRQAIEFQQKQELQENGMQEYLHNKLKQANKRYFAKFTTDHPSQINQSKRQITAMDLYIQPHFYQEISLTKFIKHTLNH